MHHVRSPPRGHPERGSPFHLVLFKGNPHHPWIKTLAIGIDRVLVGCFGLKMDGFGLPGGVISSTRAIYNPKKRTPRVLTGGLFSLVRLRPC